MACFTFVKISQHEMERGLKNCTERQLVKMTRPQRANLSPAMELLIMGSCNGVAPGPLESPRYPRTPTRPNINFIAIIIIIPARVEDEAGRQHGQAPAGIKKSDQQSMFRLSVGYGSQFQFAKNGTTNVEESSDFRYVSSRIEHKNQVCFFKRNHKLTRT